MEAKKMLQRRCARCGGEWQIPYLGYWTRQADAYYKQNILFFLPFYKWCICERCALHARQRSQLAWRAKSALLLGASMLVYALFMALLVLAAFQLGMEYEQGSKAIEAAAAAMLVAPVVASLYVLLAR